MGSERYDYVIVGGGLAGGWAVAGIRERDATGRILLLGDERDLPYDRPPLSKQLWKGGFELEQIFIQPRGYYEQAGVTLRLGTRAAGIERGEHTVRDEQGNRFGYRRLLLATGGAPRRLPIAGGNSGAIVYYRTVEDYRRVRAQAAPGRAAVVIGGGFIGSEMAAALTLAGMRVTMLFPERHLGARVFPPGLAEALTRAYSAHGVDVLAEDAAVNLVRREDGIEVTTRAGRALRAEVVVAGIGIAPNVELARAAGLDVGDGILVNERLETSDPDILAAGDCACFPEAVLGRRRIEHWDCAVSQGKHAGRNLAGAGQAYGELPFFYSDLFEFGYEAVGEVDSRLEMAPDWEVENQTGVVYYLGGGRVRGVLLCNVWEKVEAARALIREGRAVTPEALRGRLR
jgi:3-phenylpropionate/trans-cinnamate dioxygenase ferredoxin reductase subunit